MQKQQLGNSAFNLILIQDFIGAFAFFAPQALLITYFHDTIKITSEQLSIVLFILIFFSRIGRLFFAPFLRVINVPLMLMILQVLGGVGFYLLSQNALYLYIGAFLIGLFYGNNSIVVRIATSFLKSSALSLNYALLSTVTNIASSVGAIFLSLIFYKIGPHAMLYTMACLLLISALFTFWSTQKLSIPPQGKFLKTLISLIKRKEIRTNLLMITLLWFSYSFLITYLPLYAIDKLQQPGITWSVTAINGGIALALSYPLNWLLRKRLDPLKIICAFIIYLISFLVSILSPSHFVFYFILFSISIAEIISIPAYQSIMSKNTFDNERTAAFSLLIIFVGLGESLGSASSVFANQHADVMPVISLFLMIAIILGLYRYFSVKDMV